MAQLVDCPSCGALRHVTRASCPHCDNSGFSGKAIHRLLLAAALGSATSCWVATVKYGPALCFDDPDAADGSIASCIRTAPDAGGGDGGDLPDGGDGTPDG